MITAQLPILDIQDCTTNQKQLIENALRYAVTLPDGVLRKHDEIQAYATTLNACGLDEAGYHQAFLALKTSRAKLSKAGCPLPEKWNDSLEAIASDGGYIVRNLSKGSEYTVTLDAFGQSVTDCTCELYKFGGWCKHSDMVNAIMEDVPASATVIDICDRIEERRKVDASHLAHVLDGITLNEGQCQALAELIEFVEGFETRHLLTGFAGCGKTMLLQALVTHILQTRQIKIAFTAFSNQAVKVLRKMTKRWGLTVDCLTCHSLLGLKPVESEDKIVFEPDPGGEDKSGRYDLIVVDESSMLNEEMWDYLAPLPQKILFVGDIGQIPPVGEQESPVFSGVQNTSRLTEPVRYSGAIGVAVQELRDNLDFKKLHRFTTDTSDDGKEGVWVCDGTQWEHRLIAACKTEAWAKDSTFARAIAFTNARVNAINQRVRAAIMGAKAPQFIEGERLIAYKPILVEGCPAFMQTSDECTINGVAKGQSGEWNVWFLDVQNDEGLGYTVTILDSSERRRFEDELRTAKSNKQWWKYHSLLNAFCDLRYSYAITCHKGQGSTYQNTFVDVLDMAKMPRGRTHRERNQMIYTAAARAAKRLFIYQGDY